MGRDALVAINGDDELSGKISAVATQLWDLFNAIPGSANATLITTAQGNLETAVTSLKPALPNKSKGKGGK